MTLIIATEGKKQIGAALTANTVNGPVVLSYNRTKMSKALDRQRNGQKWRTVIKGVSILEF